MRIFLERNKCIGCGNCVSVCPKFFELVEDGKSHLKNSRINGRNEMEELEVDKIANCIKEAIEMCPVQCIKINPKS